MALALNNLKRVDMPLNQTKPNQTGCNDKDGVLHILRYPELELNH